MLLSLAPACSYPPCDGASLRVISLAEAICAAGHAIMVIGHNFTLRLAPGSKPVMTSFRLKWRSKRSAAIRALCLGGHYNELKHRNRAWERIVLDHITALQPGVIIANHIWMTSMFNRLPANPKLMICDTHNSDWQFYNNYSAGSQNPLIRRIARAAQTRCDELMRLLGPNTVLIHIAADDVADHQTRRPDLDHIVVPCCVWDTTMRTDHPNYGAEPKQLLFCGSLSNAMNSDALTYFAHKFWPAIKPVAQLTVAGSNPSKHIRRLCADNNWSLVPNFDSLRKLELYDAAHFAILPFRYGAGSKLKLLEACSRGIPVLTTSGGNCGNLRLPSFVTVSDDACDWCIAIQNTVPNDQWALQATAFNNDYSPARTIIPLLKLLECA